MCHLYFFGRYSFVETFSKYWADLVTGDIQEADKGIANSLLHNYVRIAISILAEHWYLNT